MTPPLIMIVWPVRKAASSDARNTAAAAAPSGVPQIDGEHEIELVEAGAVAVLAREDIGACIIDPDVDAWKRRLETRGQLGDLRLLAHIGLEHLGAPAERRDRARGLRRALAVGAVGE